MTPLAEIRHRSGLSRQALALVLGINPLTVGRWERGESEPRASMVKRLALVLRATEDEITSAVVRAKQAV